MVHVVVKMFGQTKCGARKNSEMVHKKNRGLKTINFIDLQQCALFPTVLAPHVFYARLQPFPV